MLKSMTAYGRASLENSLGRFTAEIQSVNRKHLEVSTYLPGEFVRFDGEIKKWIGKAVARGHVTVRVFLVSDRATPIAVRPNLPLARQIKSAWEAIASDLQVEESFELELLQGQEGVLLFNAEFKDEDAYRQALREVVSAALQKFILMKENEGKELHDDIAMRVDILDEVIQQTEARASDAADKHRKKILAKIEDLLPGLVDNEERVMREVCLFAERVDIMEEIIRFKSHLKQFRELLASPAEAVGKTIEFVVQEVNREANTIGSKASDAEVTRSVIKIKSELERIREQVQNVE